MNIDDQVMLEGRTTRQMRTAPKGALFIWGGADLGYPKSLARDLGRADLVIRPVSWLRMSRVRGVRLSAVVVDHYARGQMNADNYEALAALRRASSITS